MSRITWNHSEALLKGWRAPQAMYKAYRSSLENMASSTSTQSEEKVDQNNQVLEENSANSTVRKDFKSALIILPPENVWQQIQDIRRIHDDRFERWMPHINMVYRFYKDEGDIFAESAEYLKRGLCSLKPFKVRFTKQSFNYFVHKKYCTLWLRPLLVDCGSEKFGSLGFARQDDGSDSSTALGCDKTRATSNSNSPEAGGKRRYSHGDVEHENLSISAGASGFNMSESEALTYEVQEFQEPETRNSKALPLDHSEIETEKKTEESNVADSNEGCISGQNQSRTTKKVKPTKQEKKAAKKQKQKEGSLKSDDAVNYPPHPEVMKLHSMLQQLYPDLASHDDPELGFQPHLSLGQFKQHEVEEFKEKFKSEWMDIDFTVSEVFLISRKDFHDPFHVRETVPLGTCEFD